MVKRWTCVLLALLVLGGCCGKCDDDGRDDDGGIGRRFDETDIRVRSSDGRLEFEIHKPAVEGGAPPAENCPTGLVVNIDVYRDEVTLLDVTSRDYYIPEFEPLDGYIQGDTFEFDLDGFTLTGTLLHNDDVLAVELDFDDGRVCEYELGRD